MFEVIDLSVIMCMVSVLVFLLLIDQFIFNATTGEMVSHSVQVALLGILYCTVMVLIKG